MQTLELPGSPKVFSPERAPRFSISPLEIQQGSQVELSVTNAAPNMEIRLFLRDMITGKILINGSVIGRTDANGQFIQTFDSTNWSIGRFSVFIVIGSTNFDPIEFTVVPRARICPTSLSRLSPTGIVRPTGDVTLTDLSWPSVPGAISYNVRLYDGTSERYDDPRFETCQGSPYYYCENGITTTSINNVPVKKGRAYFYWVEPVVPECGYFKGYTTFSVTNFNTLPILEIIDTETGLIKIIKGRSASVIVYNAPPNSQTYIALLDAFGTPITSILPLGITQADGRYRLDIGGDKTAQWKSGFYNAFAIFFDQSLSEYVVSEKAKANVTESIEIRI